MVKKLGKNGIIALIVLMAIFISSSSAFLAYKPQKTAAEPVVNAENGVFDKIADSAALKAIGNVGSVFTVVNGIVSLGGSILNGVEACQRAEKGAGTKAFFKGLLGGESAAGWEVLDELKKIDATIEKIEGTVEDIDKKVDELNKDMKNVIKMIDDVKAGINGAVEEITVNLNKTQLAMRDWTANYTEISNFYHKYSDVRTTLMQIIEDVKNLKIDQDNFFATVLNEPNGNEIMAVIEKITFNFQQSYNGLTDAERALIDSEITFKGSPVKISKYIFDYNEYMYAKMKDVYDKFTASYSVSMFDTVSNMADYILGKKQFLNGGIGEVMYRLAVMSCSTNYEVHEVYKNFINNIIYDYLLTAYICNMSLNMQMNYLKDNNMSQPQIDEYERHTKKIIDTSRQIMIYADYEYKKCVDTYDNDGFEPAPGHDYNDYTIYYGNPANLVKYGYDKNRYVLCSNIDPSSAYLNGQYANIAVNQMHQVKVFYMYDEIQQNLEWKSSNPDVAVVSNGKVVAVSPGDCTVGVMIKNEYKPLVLINVSNCIASYTGDGKNTYNYKEGESIKSYVIEKGEGLTFDFAGDVFVRSAIFNDERKNFLLAEKFNIPAEDLDKYEFITANPYFAIENGKVYFQKGSTGVVSAKRKIANKDVVLQIPIICKREVEDKLSEFFDDGQVHFNPDAGVDTYRTYIYTLEDLLNWLEEYPKKIHNYAEPNGTKVWYKRGEYVELMEDIDFEWNVFRLDYFSPSMWYDGRELEYLFYYNFFGNGHTIKNVTISQDGRNNAMIGILQGKVQDLTIENVRFKTFNTNHEKRNKSFAVLASEIWDSYTDLGVKQFTLKGTVSIEADENTSSIFFSPVFQSSTKQVAPLWDKESSTWGHSQHKRFINLADIVIDCKGKDIPVNIVMTNRHFQKSGSIYGGSISVINVVDNTRVKVEEYIGYLQSGEPPYHLPGFSITTTNTKGETVDLTPKPKKELTSEDAQNPDFWRALGYSDDRYDLSFNGPWPIPVMKPTNYLQTRADDPKKADHIFLTMLGTKFRTLYKVGETIDTSNIRVLKNGVDVTKDGTFNTVDTSTAGDKELIFTYDEKTLTVPICVTNLPELITVTYVHDEYTEGQEDVSFSAYDNVDVQLSDNIFKRVGYNLIGWRTVEEHPVEYRSVDSASFYHSVKLKPIWGFALVEYTLITSTETKNYDFVEEVKKEQGFTGFFVEPPAAETGYICENPESVIVKGDGSTVLRAKYLLERTNVNVVYDKEKTIMQDGVYKKEIPLIPYAYVKKECIDALPRGHWMIDCNPDDPENYIQDGGEYVVKYVPHDYTVTFMIGDKVFKKVENLGGGDWIDIDYPTKDDYDTSAPEGYERVFDGWDQNYDGTVKGDIVYNAVFVNEIKQCPVKFDDTVMIFNENKIVSNGQRVPYGTKLKIEYRQSLGYEMDEFNVTGATKLSDSEYKVTGPLTVTCTEKLLEFNVNFFSNEKLLKSYKVQFGKPVSYDGEAPTCESTEEFDYIFAGWDSKFDEVMDNLDVHALFAGVVRQYTYTFYLDDGTTIIREIKGDYGERIKAPTAPLKYEDEKYTYTFTGWNNGYEEGMTLTKDVSFVAQFEQSAKKGCGSSVSADLLLPLSTVIMGTAMFVIFSKRQKKGSRHN